jgi:putative transposase
MISAADRLQTMQLIDEAVAAGARQEKACEVLELSLRTVQRWRHVKEDGRPAAKHNLPGNKLSEEERLAILEVANQPEYANLTPHQIVPKLADKGVYLASESTFYRVLKAKKQDTARGRSKPPQRRPVTTHMADGPNQVWCWDITWMPTLVKGQFYYWYMMKDVYSRKLVVNEVHASESSEQAAELLRRGCLREKTAGNPLVLHSDNGSSMKGATMLVAMQELGVSSSFSRPRVSNDNAFAEALFRTAKYCPQWPETPFESLDDARLWVDNFVQWYNEEHCHSSLKYVTPNQRHNGEADEILRKREEVYRAAREKKPQRWTGETRDWELEDTVYLNPERAAAQEKKCRKAA